MRLTTTFARASKDHQDADMPKAPPAEQAMQRNHVAEVVGGDLKLDASEFDGCWLELPVGGGRLWFCCGTKLHAQKHIDTDTVVSQAVELSVLSACFPCFCPCVTWMCCPQKYLGLRAAHEGMNSFDYVHLEDRLVDRLPKINVDNPWAPVKTMRRHGYDCDENDSDDEEGEVLLDAKGFEKFGHLCNTSEDAEWPRSRSSHWTWRYNSGSQVTIIDAKASRGADAKASRLAPACCFALSANSSRHHQLYAAYFAGYHGKGDRPLTSAEQDDKEACISTFAGALKSGNIPVLKRYRAVIGGLKPVHTNILAANGHFEALKWTLEEGVELDPIVCAAAAGSGNLETLKFCKENGASLNRSLVSEKAVMSMSVECVEYCHKNGAPWSNKTLSLAVSSARRKSHPPPEILKYCLDNGAPEATHAIEDACRMQALEFVKVFAESSHPFPTGKKDFEVSDHCEEVCDEIKEICAGKGYDVSYSKPFNTSY